MLAASQTAHETVCPGHRLIPCEPAVEAIARSGAERDASLSSSLIIEPSSTAIAQPTIQTCFAEQAFSWARPGFLPRALQFLPRITGVRVYGQVEARACESDALATTTF